MEFKERVYKILVNANPEAREYYEQYVRRNLDFHRANKVASYKYFLSLRSYYKHGMKGTMPKVPKGAIESSIHCQQHLFQGWMSDYDLIANSNYFDRKWYLEKYPDVKNSNCDPVQHYLNEGWKEYRRPGPSFSTLLYLNRYEDVNTMWINPLLHFEKIGKNDKRASSSVGLQKGIARELKALLDSPFFDVEWYEKNMPNNLTGESAVVHYYCLGCYLKMEPGPLFDSEMYVGYYPEIAQKPIPPLLHYELVGKNGGHGYYVSTTAYYKNHHTYLQMLLGISNLVHKIMTSNKIGKKVLLISHLMNLTGAPKVLLNMAVVLKELGYYPIIMALKSGEMNDEAKRLGIEFVQILPYEDKELAKPIVDFANLFDYIVYNTVEGMRLAHIFNHTKACKICWLHEGDETLKRVNKKQIKRINLMDQIFSGSYYCNKFFEPYLEEDKVIDVLHYSIDEEFVEMVVAGADVREDTSKMVFLIVATIGYRKGHHILFEAIRQMTDKIRSKVEFWCVGEVIDTEVGEMLDEMLLEYECIKKLGQMSNSKYLEILAKGDVLLCPSIDDPLPVVVTEALLIKKPVLISDGVGTARYIKDGVSGYVVEKGNSDALKKALEKIVLNQKDFKNIVRNGYDVYKTHFSTQTFFNNVERIFTSKSNKTSEELRIISNEVTLYDIEIRANTFRFIFDCDKDNELAILTENATYNETQSDEKRWFYLNEYLLETGKRIALIDIEEYSLFDVSALVFSKNFDTIMLKIGTYSWLSFNKLAKKGCCIHLKESVISFKNKQKYASDILESKTVSSENKELLKQIQDIQEYKYNIYCETRNNKNDNAYSLFLYDLRTNEDAYFITTKEVYDTEENQIIKDHMLILNSELSKDILLKAKNIIVSWYAVPLFGYERMKLFYPFMNLNYIFVPHGISFDKNSFYLNKSIWGEYSATFCTSKYEKEYFEEYLGYKNVHVLGYPRMDKWSEAKLDEKEVLIFPSWRTIIDEHYINEICEVARNIVREHPQKTIIYGAHTSIEWEDYLKIKMKLFQISKNIITFMCDEGEKFNKYFRTAKYLITDYSSVAYDFSYKNGGISIYYTPFCSPNDNYQLRTIFYKANCGVVINSSEKMIEVLSEQYDYGDIDKRVHDFFTYHDNNNSERVLGRIRETNN